MRDPDDKPATSWPLTSSVSSNTHKQAQSWRQPSPPAHPVSRHSFPASVTPVRPVSLREGGGGVSTPAIHIPFLHLFIYLFESLCFLARLHAVRFSACYTPLMSQSDVLSLNLPPLTGYKLLELLGIHRSTDPLFYWLCGELCSDFLTDFSFLNTSSTF